MGLTEFVRQAHVSSYAARVAIELSTRHGMDIGRARELVRNVREAIELMYVDGLSPALVARRVMLATQDGITDPTALARALNAYTDPGFAAGVIRIC
jgi:hypothetical protein